MFIDAHCHLADSRFDGIRDQVLARARQKQIHHFLQGGVDPDDWRRQEMLAIPQLLPCFGLHPWFVNGADLATCHAALQDLEAMLPRAVALGELGLDRGPRMDSARFEQQKEMFGRQLQIAQRYNKPLVLHVVRAHDQTLHMLREHGQAWRGLVHGFTGAYEVARGYLDLGLAISVGGAVGRSGYKKLKNALGRIPRDQLLVESDAPDMAPDTYARSLNEPESVWTVAQIIGQITDRTAEEILAQSRDNLARILSLELNP